MPNDPADPVNTFVCTNSEENWGLLFKMMGEEGIPPFIVDRITPAALRVFCQDAEAAKQLKLELMRRSSKL